MNRVTGVEATERRLRGLPRPALASRTAAALLWRHRALVALLAGGLAVRAVALAAIYPGLWFTDSNGYVTVAATGNLMLQRVSGYGLFVWPFYRLGSAGALVIAQHLLALAAVLGVSQQPGRTMTESVADAPQGRRRLLVIDNCEHLLDAAADMTDAILTTSDTVKVIATSREGLRLNGEQLWQVPSLDVGSSAATLFVDRASAVAPAVSLLGDTDAVMAPNVPP